MDENMELIESLKIYDLVWRKNEADCAMQESRDSRKEKREDVPKLVRR